MDMAGYFCLTDHHATETCKCLPGFFLFGFHSTFVSPPPSLSLSLLVAINYTDSLTGWNKEIKHLNIVSWCMHSSLLPNTDIEEILHSSCQLTKLHPSSQASISAQLHSFQKNMQGLPSSLPKSFLYHFQSWIFLSYGLHFCLRVDDFPTF